MAGSLVDIWKGIIKGDGKSWVLFEHGTCVVLMEPEDNLGEQAKGLLREFGPVHAGSPAGDFGVIRLRDAPGWVVTGQHQDILTYVSPDELTDPSPKDLSVGIRGRTKRGQDAAELNIIHIEAPDNE